MTSQKAKVLTSSESAKAPVVLTERQRKLFVICTQCDAKEAKLQATRSALSGVVSSGGGLISVIGGTPTQKIRYRQGPRNKEGISPEVPERVLEREGIKGFDSSAYCDGCAQDMKNELARRRIELNAQKGIGTEGIRK